MKSPFRHTRKIGNSPAKTAEPVLLYMIVTIAKIYNESPKFAMDWLIQSNRNDRSWFTSLPLSNRIRFS